MRMGSHDRRDMCASAECIALCGYEAFFAEMRSQCPLGVAAIVEMLMVEQIAIHAEYLGG